MDISMVLCRPSVQQWPILVHRHLINGPVDHRQRYNCEPCGCHNGAAETSSILWCCIMITGELLNFWKTIMPSSSWLSVSSLFVLPRPEDEGIGFFETSQFIYVLSTEYSITEDLNLQHSYYYYYYYYMFKKT